jgi:hypothetical protein
MRAEWHACLHRNSMQVASAKHNVSTGWLALPHPQRFDWTKGFCVSVGLVIRAVLHWEVVASLCATAPTSPNTAARSRCFRDLCVARGAPATQWPPNPGAAAAIFGEPGARLGLFCVCRLRKPGARLMKPGSRPAPGSTV